MLKSPLLTAMVLLIPLFALATSTQPPSKTITILALGDSLTEGYGIEKSLAFPSLVEKKFALANKNIKIINAGISGSTSASSVSRLKWFLKNKPDYLFLALGANDGLRGLNPAATKKNLLDTIRLAKENNIKVLLVGMKIPANYGKPFKAQFEKIYPTVARTENIPLLPFLLENVATRMELNQPDGIHPNAAGHAVIANQVFQFLNKHIRIEGK